MISPDKKHRTIGVSLKPDLREAAQAAAHASGMSFSRFVGECIEARIEGKSFEERQLEIRESKPIAARDSEWKGRFKEETARVLDEENFAPQRNHPFSEDVIADFYIDYPSQELRPAHSVAIVCEGEPAGQEALLLGKGLFLKPYVDTVIFCFPSERLLPEKSRKALEGQGLRVAGLDTLGSLVRGVIGG